MQIVFRILFIFSFSFFIDTNSYGQDARVDLGEGYFLAKNQSVFELMYCSSCMDTTVYYFKNSTDTTSPQIIPRIVHVVIPSVSRIGFNKSHILSVSIQNNISTYWLIYKQRGEIDWGMDKHEERIILSNVKRVSKRRFLKLQQNHAIHVAEVTSMN